MVRHVLPLLLALALPTHAASPGNPLAPPDPAAVTEARALVAGMVANARGPYSRIAWFCNDGTVHPPRPYACAERGGGRQHAEYSRERMRLAELGWPVGTVFAALDQDALWSPETRHRRLRHLPLERYMEEIDDGWVLRRARDYRGRVQLEDEEQAGRLLLLGLIARKAWVQEEFLLVRELARVIPHGGEGDRTRTVRRLAQEIADADPAFGMLRIEVHSRPSSSSAARVRAWVDARPGLASDLAARARQLADGLDALYGDAGRDARLREATRQLARRAPAIAETLRGAAATEGRARVAHLAEAMEALRGIVDGRVAAADLAAIDLLQDLEAELRVAALQALESPATTRRDLLALALDLLRAAHAGGWVTAGELAMVRADLEPLAGAAAIPAATYAAATRRLAQVPGWATLAVRHTFAEALVAYTALDTRANRFTDDLLRGSLLLPFGELVHRLVADAAHATGLEHRVLGQRATGLLGINPGVARGRLRFVAPGELEAGGRVANDEIVVLPETAAELTPVAGILTLGEGNPLSHVQMLARNLGIPNAALEPGVAQALRAAEGREVLYAVAGDGRVVLAPATATGAPTLAPAFDKVAAPRPDLSVTRPLPLAELHAGLSGRVVGPKAANVGELARLFPGRITASVALPFGSFARHTEAPRARLAEAFRRHRDGGLDRAGLEAELDAVRAAVQATVLEPETRAELDAALDAELGTVPGPGLFVRSDTNVEDLPQFTGAGLNETVPNVVGREAQVAAIARVWASPYSRRAMAWRERVLLRPEEVFTSVLLMRSVPAEKSGVLVTRDLATGGPGMTVSVAWGVGGAVDNESAASLVLRPDGSTYRLAEAKAPYRRVLRAAGGFAWEPAQVGPVLDADEAAALRELAAEVLARYPAVHGPGGIPLPWDIEFAFAEGKAWLLQIRPLVQRGRVEADRLVAELLPPAAPAADVPLDLPLMTGER